MKTGKLFAFPAGQAGGVFVLAVMIAAFTLPQNAQAGFSLGAASNYAVLYEGNGGHQLNFSQNSGVTGNVGVGGTGQVGGVDANTLTIIGSLDFANSSGTCANCTPTSVPNGPHYNVAAVAQALSDLHQLNHNLGLESGTNVAINGGGSVNASSGMLDATGNRVFNVTGVNFPNGTFTVNGGVNDFVVFNVTSSANFHGIIALAGGIISDHVLFNFTGGNDATRSGGPTLDVNTNGLITTGTFLDPNGTMSLVNATLNGRFFGGDSNNMQIVSGGHVNQPPSTVPEPNSISVLLGLSLATALVFRRKLASS
jgi:hypothetical protein